MLITKAISRFKLTSINEEVFSESEGDQKLISGKFNIRYSGDITGDSVLMELKNYKFASLSYHLWS
ncbi:MAG: hypothetical protein H7235_00895 [Bdellovibrionaceae bacterium]|nr:hypothetical protein [Pseudobdellovibrionaceae bacterium]